MDMTQFDVRALTNTTLLEHFAGHYVGTIDHVELDEVNNRFLGEKVKVPVLYFEDGWQWIPNASARKALKASMGTESDRYVGAVVEVALEDGPMKTNPATGQREETYVKVLAVLRLPARQETNEPDAMGE